MLTFLLQGLAFGISAAAAPGLYQTFAIQQTLTGGWRRGVLVTLAVFISDPPVVIAILLVLNQLPQGFLRWVGLLGGAFALYLAWGQWRGWKTAAVVDGGPTNAATFAPGVVQPSTWETIRRAAAINVLSPGMYTFWILVLGPLLLDALRQSVSHGAAFLAGLYTAFTAGMLLIVLAFHQARRFGPRVTRGLEAVSILVLSIFGLTLLWNAFQGQV